MKKNSILLEDAKNIFDSCGDIFSELSGKNLLITGGAGFLCSYFLDIFSIYNMQNPGKEINILATDNFLSGIPERLEAFNGIAGIEIRNHNVLKQLDEEITFDYIIHGASVASPIYYRKYPLETIDVNINGTWNMLKRAQADKSKAILYFSSSEVYGDPDPARVPSDETYLGNVETMGPRACYDESKRLGETLCYNFYHQHGVPVKVVRPFNVYGPGQNLNDERILPDLLSASIENKDIVLFSDGTPTRSFVYVRDFMKGTLGIMFNGKPAEPYNVGNDEEVSISQVAAMMCDAAKEFGRDISVKFETSQDEQYLEDNPNRRCPDLQKTKSTINWKPEIMVREGLSRTLSSYLEEETLETQAKET